MEGNLKTPVIRKKKVLIPRLITISLLFVFLFLLILASSFLFKYLKNNPSIRTVYTLWNKNDYQSVYDVTKQILTSKPYAGTALVYHGYSAFYLAISQNDTTKALEFIDESINYLRIAMRFVSSKILPQLEYMLGKAYFHKNSLSSYYYYADLSTYYINKAIEDGFEAEDIPQYLGLGYAQLSMTKESIAAFTQALDKNESDILLLAIAEQYIKSNKGSIAKQYLYRLISTTKDELLSIKASELIASIYFEEGDYNNALVEYNSILEKKPDEADAYYGIGLIYEQKGDMIKARAEWRKALKVQVNHPGALKKLG